MEGGKVEGREGGREGKRERSRRTTGQTHPRIRIGGGDRGRGGGACILKRACLSARTRGGGGDYVLYPATGTIAVVQQSQQ